MSGVQSGDPEASAADHSPFLAFPWGLASPQHGGLRVVTLLPRPHEAPSGVSQ